MMMKRINCVGDICPVPVIKVKKALAEGTNELDILVDNEIAVQNISKMLNSMGCSFFMKKEGEHFLISVSSRVITEEDSKRQLISNNQAANCVVIISSEFMGTGDNTLGSLLMEGFIFAITQQDILSKTVAFYNGGVRHTLKNAKAIGDLQYLKQQGVEIFVCGTCLNHFNVLEDLEVGEITNMYEIVKIMQHASCIIRP